MTKVHTQVRLDYDAKGENNLWLKTWSVRDYNDLGYHTFFTLSGQRWGSIERRVKNTAQRPTYFGTSNDFSDFQEFTEWSVSEVGYNSKEVSGRMWAMDKDILGNGKSYSSETCIFVPQKVNNFLTLRTKERGEHPLGVHYIERGGKFYYCASVNMGKGGESRISDVFYTEQEAHRFWQSNKIICGRKLASEFEGWHDRLYIGLSSWVDKIQEDYDNHRETVV